MGIENSSDPLHRRPEVSFHPGQDLLRRPAAAPHQRFQEEEISQAFRELGRASRTITLLRYLTEPELRESITAITNRVEAFHGFSHLAANDPDRQPA